MDIYLERLALQEEEEKRFGKEDNQEEVHESIDPTAEIIEQEREALETWKEEHDHREARASTGMIGSVGFGRCGIRNSLDNIQATSII